jgi:hypothetical protein
MEHYSIQSYCEQQIACQMWGCAQNKSACLKISTGHCSFWNIAMDAPQNAVLYHLAYAEPEQEGGREEEESEGETN